MDDMMDDIFEHFIEKDELLDRIGARLVAPLLPAATRAQRRQVLEQREQARAAREELRRGVARSRELTRKIRRLKRMANADVSGYPAARREAHERETRRLAREIFGSDA
ncbi:hypothetical protein OsI_38014 [Oryza sativa Indica Group]|uniref:Uncharacterized protein n=1 Tax=Oryza sativa subsp. indica TaxID=39946 RepID=A2ZJM4_ORYSI|nr:hypothetical protein OsI_38014 [Oryza sativa Indica Group]